MTKRLVLIELDERLEHRWRRIAAGRWGDEVEVRCLDAASLDGDGTNVAGAAFVLVGVDRYGDGDRIADKLAAWELDPERYTLIAAVPDEARRLRGERPELAVLDASDPEQSTDLLIRLDELLG